MKMKCIAALVFLVLLTAAAYAGEEDACSHVTLEWIGTHVPLSKSAKIVLKREQGEFCEVVMAIDGNLAPVYAGKTSLVAGRLFEQGRPVTLETMKSLSDVAEQERQNAREKQAMAVEKRKMLFKTRINELEPLVSMSFGPGSAQGFIYVITDPNCSHCKDLLSKLEEMAFEAKLTLKMIIYPVLGPKSREMAAHALCKDYTYATYKEMEKPENPATCDKADQLIGKTEDLLRPAGISFVPLVVASDGTWIVEGNDICKVRTHLGLPSGDTDGTGKGCGPGENQ